MSSPMYALTNPMNLDFRARGLGPNGSEANHFQDAAGRMSSFSYGSLEHFKCVWSPYHTSHYDWQTNGTSTYHSSQTLGEFVKGDTGRDQLLFAETPPKGALLESDKRLHGQNMYGLSMLNYMMRYEPRWRRKYGAIRNGTELMHKYINYRGIQKTPQALLGIHKGKLYSDEQNYIVFGRANVPNVWLAQGPKPGTTGGHVGMGMSLYVLVRRHRFVENVLSHEDQAMDPMTRAMAGAPRLREEDDEDEEHLNRARKRRMVRTDMPRNDNADNAIDAMFNDMANPGDTPVAPLLPEKTFGQRAAAVELNRDDPDKGEDTADKDEEYYWSFDPWTSVDRTNPSPELYCNANGEGTFIHIGQVLHLIKGTNNRSEERHAAACKAVYPQERNGSYLDPLMAMDKLEIMVGVGTVGF